MNERPSSSSVTLLGIVQLTERVSVERRQGLFGRVFPLDRDGTTRLLNQHVDVVVSVQVLLGSSRIAGIYRMSIWSQVAGSRGVPPGGKLGVE